MSMIRLWKQNKNTVIRVLGVVLALCMALSLPINLRVAADGTEGEPSSLGQSGSTPFGAPAKTGRGVTPSLGWSVAAKLTTQSGQEGATVIKGQTLELRLEFTAPRFDVSLLENPYFLYLRKDIFKETQGGGKIGYAPAHLGGHKENPLVYDGAQTLTAGASETIDAQEYWRYQIKFNDSVDALQFYENEGITSASLTIWLTIDTETIDYEAGEIVRDADGTSIVVILPEMQQPGEDAKPNVSKEVVSGFRPNGDSYQKLNSGEQYQVGDYVLYSIKISNNTSAVEKQRVELRSVSDTPGAGYSVYAGNNKWPTELAAYIESERLVDNAHLTSENISDWAAYWEGSGPYTHTYDPYRLIEPQTSITLYMLTQIKVADNTQLTNSAAVSYKGGTVSGSGGVNTDGVYDLALQNRAVQIKSKDNLVRGSNATVPLLDGDSIWTQVKVENQGTLSVGKQTYYLYVPAAFELSTTPPTVYEGDRFEDKNAGTKWTTYQNWEEISSAEYAELAKIKAAADPESVAWSTSLRVYRQSNENGIAPKGVYTMHAYLTIAEGYGYDQYAARPLDFVVGAEIGYFESPDGKQHEGQTALTAPFAATTGFQDFDSFPDGNPYNDFLGEWGNGGPWTYVSATDKTNIVSKAKEWSERTNKHARVGNAYSRTEDEDDFDYHAYKFGKPSDTPGEGADGVLIRKKQAVITQKKDLDDLLYSSDVQNTFWTTYEPISDQGYITKPNTYVVYDILVNEDGLRAIDKMEVEDILPPGLKVYSYNANVSSTTFTFYGFSIRKTVGNPYHMIDGVKTIVEPDITTKLAGIFGNGWRSPAGFSGGHANGNPGYGMTVTIGNVVENGVTYLNRKFHLTLDPSAITHKNDDSFYTEKNAEYQIRILAVADQAHITAMPQGKEYFNTATVTIEGESTPATENSYVRWDFNGTATYASKYVMKDGAPYRNPDYNVVVPTGSDMEAAIDYRVRVRAVMSADNSEHKAGVLNTTDTFDTGIVKRVSTPVVTGYADGGGGAVWNRDGSLVNPEEMAGGVRKVSATINGGNQSLEIKNDEAINRHELYNVDFTVSYHHLKYGAPVTNEAGTKVFTAVPLKLSLRKVDAVTKAAIADGYTFEAFYYDAAEDALGAKLLDYQRGSNVLDSDHPDLLILPEGYTLYGSRAGEWKIALVETQAPSGYRGKDNQGVTFLVTVRSDSQGVLTIADISRKADSGVGTVESWSADSQTGAVTFTAGNQPDDKLPEPDNFYLTKVDDKGKGLDKAVGFTITNTATNDTLSLTTGAATGKSNSIRLSAGTYRIQEDTVPEGYDPQKTAQGVFTLSLSGDALVFAWVGSPSNMSGGVDDQGMAFVKAVNYKLESGEPPTDPKTDPPTEENTPPSGSSEPTTGNPGGEEPETPSGSTDPVEPVTPTNPTNPTGSSGGSSASDTTQPITTAPTATTDATVSLPGSSESYGTPSRDSGPNTSEDFVPIGDLPVPLANIPALSEIFDDDVPLAMLPQTGGSAFSLLAALSMGLAGVGLLLRRKED